MLEADALEADELPVEPAPAIAEATLVTAELTPLTEAITSHLPAFTHNSKLKTVLPFQNVERGGNHALLGLDCGCIQPVGAVCAHQVYHLCERIDVRIGDVAIGCGV